VRRVACVSAAVDEHRPLLSIGRALDDILLMRVCLPPERLHVLFGEVHLKRMNFGRCTEVDAEPFAGVVGACAPVREDVFVERVDCRMYVELRRCPWSA
jgi:hypothetical protein